MQELPPGLLSGSRKES